MTAGGTERLLPAVTGFAARQAIAALRKRNIATAPLLHRAGLSEHDFASLGESVLVELKRLLAALNALV